ncbi:MAG: hypothetical protein HY292_03895, partial [Planctomycetes bacterium]|nr:hypothetical protein [Planctomycetota bacterium]
ATYRQALNGFIPRDADVGSRLKVGMLIGMSGHADDLRAVYASALVVRGVTDNSGGQVGTVIGSGPLVGRHLGGNGPSTNTAPQPRTDPEPGLPTRRRR